MKTLKIVLGQFFTLAFLLTIPFCVRVVTCLSWWPWPEAIWYLLALMVVLLLTGSLAYWSFRSAFRSPTTPVGEAEDVIVHGTPFRTATKRRTLWLSMLLGQLVILLIYAGSYVTISVGGRYEPALIGLNGVKIILCVGTTRFRSGLQLAALPDDLLRSFVHAGRHVLAPIRAPATRKVSD